MPPLPPSVQAALDAWMAALGQAIVDSEKAAQDAAAAKAAADAAAASRATANTSEQAEKTAWQALEAAIAAIFTEAVVGIEVVQPK